MVISPSRLSESVRCDPSSAPCPRRSEATGARNPFKGGEAKAAGGVNIWGDKAGYGCRRKWWTQRSLAKDALKLVQAVVLDDQPALAAARVTDAHLGARPFGELLLQQADVGIDGAVRGGMAAGII